MTLNARLAAILEKHPQLRPTQDGRGLIFTGPQWGWTTTRMLQTCADDAAHALIFRAMVEGLRSPNLLRPCPFGNEGRWYVSDDGGNRVYGDTALAALLAFWESRPAQEKP